ncbi:MAG TPA: prenyltransferase/squalene oxidase repeat-containing protein [Solirubrobacteraceae bacterium]|jgi:energy-coupling factor transport system substrate-specific component
MSWQLSSFAIVLGCLAVAFWWYERSHPPAKLLAIVATLAALAALGRDAFAAIPDVKPITSIVLVGGIVFGAGPGFTIGAISGLASNVLLGQGPWTPWQMLGWGLVGLLGAALGKLGGGRLPPLGLALACAVGAELFNLVLDFYTLTGTANHSLAGFELVLGTAFVFDLTHVIASFAFGLAFGSVLLRMLVRVRARLDVEWVAVAVAAPVPAAVAPATGQPSIPALAPAVKRRSSAPALALASAGGLAALVALAVALTHHDGGPAQEAPPPAAVPVRSQQTASSVGLSSEISYLQQAQNRDGGFGAAPGQESSELYSAWVALGLAAANRDPLSIQREGHDVLDELRAEAATLHGAGDLERTILALHACGVSTRALPGGDPVARLLKLRAGDGSFANQSNLTAFGVFALRAAGYAPHSRPIRAALAWLRRQQDQDGGYGFTARGGPSDVDDTGAVLQALAAGGDLGQRTAVGRAIAYLRRAQNADGGFPQEAGGSSNAQSTAWAIQGLVAAKTDVEAFRRRGSHGSQSRSPLAYLRGLVAPDGSVRYSATGQQTPVWVTAQALTALAGKPLPVAPVKSTT